VAVAVLAEIFDSLDRAVFLTFFSEFASAGLVRRAGLEAVGVALAGWYRWKEGDGSYRMVVVRMWQWQYWRR
jgi:hypothetical protein